MIIKEDEGCPSKHQFIDKRLRTKYKGKPKEGLEGRSLKYE